MNRLHKMMLMEMMNGGSSQIVHGFSYTQESYASFVTGLSATGCTVEDLGTASDDATHVYGLSYGDAEKPCIMLIGNLHGTEWQNAYIIRKFMSYLVNPPAANRIYFEQILDRFQFYAIPCASPYGYANAQQPNADGVNLSRNFDYQWAAYDDSGDIAGAYPAGKGASAFSEAESVIIRDKFLALKPVGFMDFHIEGGSSTSHLLCLTGRDSFFTSLNTYLAANIDSNLQYSNNIEAQPWAGQWADQQTTFKCIGGTYEEGLLLSNEAQAKSGLTCMLQFSLLLKALYTGAQSFNLQPANTAGNDTQISASAVTSNYGTNSLFSAGRDTGAGTIRRAMLEFEDLLSNIPAGATITSAIVTLYCENAAAAAQSEDVSFHRALTEWFEGAQSAGVPAGGEDASTWNLRNANGSVAWGAVGGLADTDYASTPTDTAAIAAKNIDVTWTVTADVQAWIDGDASNYGWWIIGDDGNDSSRKMFTSANGATAANRPEIAVQFTL